MEIGKIEEIGKIGKIGEIGENEEIGDWRVCDRVWEIIINLKKKIV